MPLPYAVLPRGVTRTEVRTQRMYEVTGQPDITDLSKTLRAVLWPTAVTVYLSDGEVRYADVTGPAVRRDGSLGKERHAYYGRSFGNASAEPPSWLLNLFICEGLEWPTH